MRIYTSNIHMKSRGQKPTPITQVTDVLFFHLLHGKKQIHSCARSTYHPMELDSMLHEYSAHLPESIMWW